MLGFCGLVNLGVGVVFLWAPIWVAETMLNLNAAGDGVPKDHGKGGGKEESDGGAVTGGAFWILRYHTEGVNYGGLTLGTLEVHKLFHTKYYTPLDVVVSTRDPQEEPAFEFFLRILKICSQNSTRVPAPTRPLPHRPKRRVSQQRRTHGASAPCTNTPVDTSCQDKKKDHTPRVWSLNRTPVRLQLGGFRDVRPAIPPDLFLPPRTGQRGRGQVKPRHESA